METIRDDLLQGNSDRRQHSRRQGDFVAVNCLDGQIYLERWVAFTTKVYEKSAKIISYEEIEKKKKKKAKFLQR